MYRPFIFDDRIGVCIDGTIFNYKTRKVIKQHKTKSGYMNIVITSPGKKHKGYRVHRLYAIMYIERPPDLKNIPFDLLEVNHKDGNKINNTKENLEWVTSSGNSEHAVLTGLTTVNKPIQIFNYRTGEITELKSMRRVAKSYGIPLPTISKHLRGKRAGMFLFGGVAFRYTSNLPWPEISNRNRSWFTCMAINKQTNISITFDTLAELARFTKVKYSTVNRALITKDKASWENTEWVIKITS